MIDSVGGQMSCAHCDNHYARIENAIVLISPMSVLCKASPLRKDPRDQFSEQVDIDSATNKGSPVFLDETGMGNRRRDCLHEQTAAKGTGRINSIAPAQSFLDKCFISDLGRLFMYQVPELVPSMPALFESMLPSAFTDIFQDSP